MSCVTLQVVTVPTAALPHLAALPHSAAVSVHSAAPQLAVVAIVPASAALPHHRASVTHVVWVACKGLQIPSLSCLILLLQLRLCAAVDKALAVLARRPAWAAKAWKGLGILGAAEHWTQLQAQNAHMLIMHI